MIVDVKIPFTTSHDRVRVFFRFVALSNCVYLAYAHRFTLLLLIFPPPHGIFCSNSTFYPLTIHYTLSDTTIYPFNNIPPPLTIHSTPFAKGSPPRCIPRNSPHCGENRCGGEGGCGREDSDEECGGEERDGSATGEFSSELQVSEHYVHRAVSSE